MRKTSTFPKLASLGLAVLLALSGSLALRPARSSDITEGGKGLWRAVVQLGPVALVKNKAGKQEVRYFGWGSGTLLSSSGIILTNHHVVDVADLVQQAKSEKGVEIMEGQLAVLLTKSPDQPPVATYIATVIGDLPDYDLAVLRITHDISGQELDPDELDLPFLRIGDSDKVELEDTLRIYGYPGIGGNTITFTRGNVSGFDNEEGIEGRAWIKTDATIAGGNSGGTAVNDASELVAIPTQAAVSSAQAVADCRRVQDTNGDGQIDEDDNCIPIGGFINALRPINLASATVRRVQTGAPVDDPDDPGKPSIDFPGDPDEPVTEGVQVVGTIVDADTGKPISGALFVVLNEGVTWDDYEGNDDQIYDAVNTDRKGKFEMTKYLERGKAYSLGWTAKGYQPVKQDDLEVTEDTPDVVEAKLKLQKE
jgi:S1-C subfamily serine protease